MRGKKIHEPFLFKCSLFTCFAWKADLKHKHRLGLKYGIDSCSAAVIYLDCKANECVSMQVLPPPSPKVCILLTTIRLTGLSLP